MDEHLVSVIWGELKRYINTVDRAEAAETVIQILMDNDSDAEDIRDAFKGDSDVKKALASYLDNGAVEEDEDDEYSEDDDDSDYDENEEYEN